MGYPIFAPQVRWGTPFWVDFCTQFGANLAPSWATLVQELVLDGLVGLREAQRVENLSHIMFKQIQNLMEETCSCIQLLVT